jgi:hypothetical protein
LRRGDGFFEHAAPGMTSVYIVNYFSNQFFVLSPLHETMRAIKGVGSQCSTRLLSKFGCSPKNVTLSIITGVNNLIRHPAPEQHEN